MRTYIINLERSVNRREHVLREVKKQKLDYKFIKAIEGAKLENSEIERLCDPQAIKDYPQWLTRGAIGCALSHCQAYQKIIGDNVKTALIIEDDVVLPNDFPELLTKVEQEIVDDEVVLLHYASFKPLNLSNQDAITLTPFFRLLYPCFLEGVTSAAGYVITKKTARSLIERIPPIHLAADSWGDFYHSQIIKSLRFVHPMPISVLGAKSTITVSSQSRLRADITTFIDDKRILPFYQALKFLRKKSVESRSKVNLVDEPHYFSKL